MTAEAGIDRLTTQITQRWSASLLKATFAIGGCLIPWSVAWRDGIIERIFLLQQRNNKEGALLSILIWHAGRLEISRKVIERIGRLIASLSLLRSNCGAPVASFCRLFLHKARRPGKCLVVTVGSCSPSLVCFEEVN